MMFLLRTAFWLSVVLALLPTFAPKQTGTAPAELIASEAVTAASATVADMSGFCDRRPDACAAGAQFASAFGQRARAGAEMLYAFVGDRLGKSVGKSDGAAGAGDAAAVTAGLPSASRPSQNTLTAVDLAPAWRGPAQHRETVNKRPA